jgi:hypothetical protein
MVEILPKPATLRANDRTKASGTVLVLGPRQTEFSAIGLISGERIASVTLTANGGTTADAAVATYLITPSEPVAPITIPANTFRPNNYAFTYIDGTLTVTTGPTFESWAGQGVELTPELLMKYAIGGAVSGSSPSELPQTNLQGTTMSLTVIVRKDSTLTIIGQAVSDLGNYGTPNLIVPVAGSAVDVSQKDVPPGCERQKFTMDMGSSGKGFLRISVTK